MISNINKFIIILSDTILFGLSYLVAYWLRFETFSVYEKYLFFRTFWWIIPVKVVISYYFKLYRGMWRYTSLSDIVNIAKMAVFSLITITSLILFFYRFEGFSRSVYIIDCLITFVFIAGIRISIRFLLGSDNLLIKYNLFKKGKQALSPANKRIIIYGAGNKGELILRTMLNSKKNNHSIVGFIDDDPKKEGRSIHGIKVLGNGNDIASIIQKHHISELLIAMHLSGEMMEQVNNCCVDNNTRCRIVPGYSDLVTGAIHISKIRDINISDLLYRDPVRIDFRAVENAIKGKRIMVTGAGGSIGSQLVSQILDFSPSQMILIDKCENFLFNLKQDIDKNSKQIERHYYCMDITHQKKIDKLFEKHRPEIIFHAAANKHVPLMEFNKDEAIYNNVFGTKVVADLSEKWKTNIFILVSTDKVVNPANAMGLSKKLCELYIQAISQGSSTSFITVRFGNVLDSNGSVIPIFKKQIKKGGPVTVTDIEVTRYFMTIPEAVLLILQSATMGKGREIFLLDMGMPVKIVDLAKRMIRLTNPDYEKSIRIQFTGLREGEKLHEELIGNSEIKHSTSHEKISVLTQKKSTSPSVINDIDNLCKEIRAGKEVDEVYSYSKSIVKKSENNDNKSHPLASHSITTLTH